jgi:biotin carboxyl carrier protein
MRSQQNNLWQLVAWLVVIVGIGLFVWLTRSQWQPMLLGTAQADDHDHETPPIEEERKILELNKQARDNLGLVAKPVKIQDYWKKIEIPGEIIDRPGVTDRGITSPLKGVVTQVHAFTGDVVRPGETLFSIRLVSDALQTAQSGLFKAVRETEIIRKEQLRIENLIRTGIVPGKRRIELNQKVSRQAALIDGYRQELMARGLNSNQIDKIKSGDFLTTLKIKAPLEAESEGDSLLSTGQGQSDTQPGSFFEIKQLKVELGYQVEAGTPLAILANHKSLYIKGHAFKKEASRIAAAAEKAWPLKVDFSDDIETDWPPIEQQFLVRHLSNATDTNSRTFEFFIPLINQSRVYEKEGRPYIVWRFRPGQRVRILTPVEEMKDVIVLPAAAVLQKGPEAFVFQQNGDLFNQLPVKILHKDRTDVVIANDGSLQPGFFLAQNAAASLHRVLKAQSDSGGLPPGFHVHADGTVHGAH